MTQEKIKTTLFQVSFEKLDGNQEVAPFFVLWEFIRSYKVSIFSVQLSKITQDFLQYIQENSLSTPEKSNFMKIACRLIHYKSRTLLPHDNHLKDEYENNDKLPLEFVDSLLEYKKYQMASVVMQQLEENNQKSFSRPSSLDAYSLEEHENSLDINILIKIIKELEQRRMQKEHSRKNSLKFIILEEWNIQDITKDIMEKVNQRDDRCISFVNYIHSFSIMRIIVSFICILELAKMQKVYLQQSKNKVDILIKYKNSNG